MTRRRTSIVTGAAGGIGEGVARGLARRGDGVVLVDLNEERLTVVEAEMKASGASVISVPTDVTASGDLARMVEAAVAAFGGVEVFVAAAGGHGGAKPAEAVEDEEWEASIALNLTGVFKSARAVIPVMREAGYGSMVFVSSATGQMPTTSMPSVSYYAAGKAGVQGLTRQLAVEFGPYGVTVNAVAPGTTLTDRVRRLRPPEALERIAETIPLGRIAEVEDQVGPILFLTSDEARYITGVTLDVNGGRLMS